MDACLLYRPCNVVLPARKTCDEAKVFVDRLLGGVEGRIAGFLGRKPKPLTAEAVFEANAPEAKFDAEWQEQFKQISERMKAAGSEVRTGAANDGSTWIYEGSISDGRFHGFGYLFWSDGNAYRGQFDQGFRSGPGDYVAPNGYRVVGPHRRNQLEGEGLRRDRNGNFSKGTFVNQKLQGRALMTFANGATHEGMFVNDLQDGPGTARQDGRTLTGVWSGGKLNGQAVYTNGLGIVSTRIYANGVIVSETSGGTAASSSTASSAAPAERGTDGSGTATLLGQVAGALLAGGNSRERRENVAGVLGGNGAGAGSQVSGTASDPRCPVEDMQPFEYYDGPYADYRNQGYVSYKPLDCVSVEWRNKAKVTDRRESGLEARIVNRCACKIQYRHVGTLRGIDDDYSIMGASHTSNWISELTEDKKFEVVPGSSCHYSDELQAKYHVKTGRCVARKCKSKDGYGNCGYSTTR